MIAWGVGSGNFGGGSEGSKISTKRSEKGSERNGLK